LFGRHLFEKRSFAILISIKMTLAKESLKRKNFSISETQVFANGKGVIILVGALAHFRQKKTFAKNF